MSDLTLADLDALDRLAREATPGPWRWIVPGPQTDDMPLLRSGSLDGPSAVICDFGNAQQYYPTEGTPPNEANMAFIAACSPEVVLQLVALATGGDEAIMEVIELTIKACDAHEKKRVPMEARDVDYAGILAKAKHITARKAARSLTPETPADA